MTRRLPIALFLGVLLLCSLRAAPPGAAAPVVRDIQLVMMRPDGSYVVLMFAVDAPSHEAALETAIAAAYELAPEASLVTSGDDGVTAQFAPWWWQWDLTELPVRVAYNSEGTAAGVTPADVDAALAAWSGVEGSAFAFHYAGATTAAAHVQDDVNDGQNVVAWRHMDCSSGCVLGLTTKTEAHETDVVLNSNPEARLGNGADGTIDTRTVLVHEAGHMAGLEHSCPLFDCSEAEEGAVMYFQYRGENRTPHEDDLAGIRALYPGTASAGAGEPQTLAIDLAAGWSLTVLPPGLLDNTMDRLVCVDAVYAWDGSEWRTWIRGAYPLLQDLVAAEPGTAYWMHARASCSYLFVLPG
ncbi:MAG: matrixin family metalloprotease, partial [Tepidiformaceae bacterium]